MNLALIFNILMYFGVSDSAPPNPDYEQLLIRRLKDPWISAFPLPPSCHDIHSATNDTHISNVTLWEWDESVSLGTGVMWWRERVHTSCTFYFFGAQESTLISSQIVTCTDECLSPPSGVIPSDRTSDLTEEPAFICSWPQTNEQTTLRIKAKGVKIRVKSTGGLYAEGVKWLETSDPNVFKNGEKRIKIDSQVVSTCPVKKSMTFTGIITQKNSSEVLIVIPQKHLMFSLDLSLHSEVCFKSSHQIFMAATHYLVSWDGPADLGNYHPSTLHELFNLPRLASSTLYSRIDSSLRDLSTDVQDLLSKITTDYCNLKLLHWTRLRDRLMADDIAFYITGDPFSVGEALPYGYKISETYGVQHTVSFPMIWESESGKIKVVIGNNTEEVEPLSGLVSKFPSRYPRGLNLLPINQSHYLRLDDKRVVSATSVAKVDLKTPPALAYDDLAKSVDAQGFEEGAVSNLPSLSIGAWGQLQVKWNELGETLRTLITVIFVIGITFLLLVVRPWSWCNRLRSKASSVSSHGSRVIFSNDGGGNVQFQRD